MSTQGLQGGRERLKAHITIETKASEKRRYPLSAWIFAVRLMPQLFTFLDIGSSEPLRRFRMYCTSAPFILYLYIYYCVKSGADSGAVAVQRGAVAVQLSPLVH